MVGTQVYEARVRYDTGDGKVVLPWHYDGARWVLGAAPQPRPLYRLGELQAYPDTPVLVVEGEKAVDGACGRFLDYVVTTTSGGCKQANHTDLVPLAGRRVVVWPDNDEPGRKYAQEICKIARRIGALSMHIVDVPESWPKAWDLADELPDGVTEEILRRMLDEAPEWFAPIEEPLKLSFTVDADVQAEVEAASEPGAKPEGPPFDPRFTFTHIDAITEPILDGAFAIDGLLMQEGIASFYGPRSCGKSFGALHAMAHVATGKPYNGRPTEKSHVLYFAAEGGQLFRNRVFAAKRALKIEPDEAALEIIHATPNLGVDDKDAYAILKAIEVQRKQSPFGTLPLIVVVDTLARTMKGAKEDETGFGTFIANCEIITKEFGGLAIAVHHSGKDPTKGLRGWSGLGAALENEWRFARLPNGRRQIVVDKVRDGEDGIGWEFEIEVVELGLNKHKRPMTTCVVNLLSEPAPVDDKTEGGDTGSDGTKKDTARSLRDFGDAFNEAMRLSGKSILLTGDEAIPTSVHAVSLTAVREEFSKRRAVSPDDDDADIKERRKKRNRAIGEAFRGVIKNLPRKYRTTVQDEITYIWKLT